MKIILVFLLYCQIIFAASNVVVNINGKPITLTEFNERYEWYVEKFKFKVSKKEFLKNLIDLELTSQEALKKGLDQDKKLQYDIKILLSQHLLEKEVYSKFDKLKISEKDLKKYFKQSPEIRVSHILFKVDEKTNEEQVKKKALSVLEKAKAGEDFSELAKKYSEGPSAKNGGDLDYFTKDSMNSEFSDAAFNLKKVGEISPLVKSKYGYHIIKLTQIRDFKSADKRRLEYQVKSQKQKELYDTFFERLKKTAQIQVNEKLLEIK